MDRFTRWVAWLKRTQKLSQEEIAERLGCSQTHVSQMQTGKCGPGVGTALAIERESAAWTKGPITVAEWDRWKAQRKAKVRKLVRATAPTNGAAS